MATGAKTLKLIQYQQTQNLLEGINKEAGFEKGLNEPSNSFALRDLRHLAGQRDRSLMRSHLETLIEVLGEHEKQTGIPDSLKSEYSRLLNRINLDPEKVSLSEFENAIKKFSSNSAYTVALQDEINNKNLDLEINPEELAEPSSSSGIVDSSEPGQKSEEDLTPGQQSGGQEESSGNQTARQAPRKEPQRVQQRQKKSAEEKSIDRHNRKMERRKPENIAERKKARKARRQQRRAQNKFNNSRLGRGLSQANNALNAPNRLSDRLGERFKNSRLGKNLARVNSLFGAPGRFLNRFSSNLGNRFANRFLNNRLGRGLGRIGRGLNKLDQLLNPVEHFMDRMMGKLASRLGRLALEGAKLAARLAMQAARVLANMAARVLGNLAQQAAGGVARGALGTAGRGIAAGLAAIGMTGFLIIIVAIIIAIGIFFLYDSYSECGQPGTVEMVKSAKKEKVGSDENIDYQINVTYKIKCQSSYAKATIRDRIPNNTSYVSGSAKASIVQLGGLISAQTAEGILDGNTLVWQLANLVPNELNTITFSVTPTQDDVWIANQATINYQTYASGALGGGFSGVTGLVPNTPPAPDWDNTKAEIIAAFNKHPELFDIYKQASAQSGVPWQILAGLHFVETGGGPGPDSSLVSGRKIGQAEPDISPAKCAAGVAGPGIPIPIGGGCGFSNQLDSMIYAGNHLAEKIGKVPSTFAETVTALSRYNGGGNANCGEGLPYQPCPPEFIGQDDPYAMADFDAAHSSDTMYLIFCGDGMRCSPPRIFGRPGAMGVVRALDEEKL